MKRVLITGITGYIGSNLARSLLDSCEVYGLVRDPLRTEYIADMQDRLRLVKVDDTYESVGAALAAVHPDIVYHLAAFYTGVHSAQAAPKLIASNITFGGYLLEAMAACNVPALVYASTVMTHYEGAAYRPLNLYAATKQAFSDLLAYYTDTGLLRAVTLVLSDTYGPGDHRPKILNLIKQAVKSRERIALSVGVQTYDVVYIDDVVSAFRMAGEQLLQGQLGNDIFQIVSEAPLSLRETVEKMLQVDHLTLDAGWGERPTAEREMLSEIRLYPTLPGWSQQVWLEDGLRRYYTSDQDDGIYPGKSDHGCQPPPAGLTQYRGN